MTAQENGKENGKQKGKGSAKGCLIVGLVILVIITVGGGIGWSFLSKEHREAAGLSLNAVNFGKLKDGVYHGLYEGGMYRWRRNECDVTVTDGRVTHIQLVGSKDPSGKNTDYKVLYARVIAAQSLQVDTVSGATLTSKGYLQAVENALLQAQHE